MDYRRGVAHLKRSDPTLARVIGKVGPCRFDPDVTGDRFAVLLESIIYQQLQGRAAAAISSRFQALYGGTFPTPDLLLATKPEALRAAGLSSAKAAAMADLARRVASGQVPLGDIHRLPDDRAVEVLSQVRGIGRWTAEMFLIFHLGRLDVLPVGDYGLRKAVQREYRMRKLPEAPRLERLSKPWRPYRTLATWYLWRSSEPILFPSGKGRA